MFNVAVGGVVVMVWEREKTHTRAHTAGLKIIGFNYSSFVQPMYTPTEMIKRANEKKCDE